MEWPRSMQTMKMAVIKKSAIFVIVFTFQIYEQPLIKVKREGAHVYAYIIQTLTLQPAGQEDCQSLLSENTIYILKVEFKPKMYSL